MKEDTEVDVANLQDYKQFSTEKMKKQNVFQSSRFFCDVYGFEPGQEQKGHAHADQDKVYLELEAGHVLGRGETRILGIRQGTMAPAGE